MYYGGFLKVFFLFFSFTGVAASVSIFSSIWYLFLVSVGLVGSIAWSDIFPVGSELAFVEFSLASLSLFNLNVGGRIGDLCFFLILFCMALGDSGLFCFLIGVCNFGEGWWDPGTVAPSSLVSSPVKVCILVKIFPCIVETLYGLFPIEVFISLIKLPQSLGSSWINFFTISSYFISFFPRWTAWE